jgi:hypothetical protein
MTDDQVLEELGRHTAVWTDDCNGKKDFDGEMVSVSTRYWPGGYQKNGWPSANAALHLNGADGSYVQLLQKSFEAPTEFEVKALVEVWVRAEWKRLVSILVAHYPVELD